MARKTRLELEAYWKKVLEDFAASSYGVGKYCQEHKISKASLYSWGHRLSIPLTNREILTNTRQVDKNDKQASFGRE